MIKVFKPEYEIKCSHCSCHLVFEKEDIIEGKVYGDGSIDDSFCSNYIRCPNCNMTVTVEFWNGYHYSKYYKER